MATHNDQPVLNCKLGRNNWRDQIAKLVISAKPPKTIAIHGTWGTGKTSVLAQLHARLGGISNYKSEESNVNPISGSKKIETIWFEAWQYQHEENIVYALLKEIREQLSPSIKVLDTLKKIGEVTLMTAFQSVDFSIEKAGVTFGIKEPGKNFKENLSDYKKRHISEPIQADVLKKLLKKAIDILLNIDNPNVLKRILGGGKSDKKLVIFIDDLDRCEPEAAFKILESIKIYLNLDNCIFILGMDMEAIQRIIAKFHEKQLSIESGPNNELIKLSRLYLEKICQDIFHIPVLEPKVKLSYFLSLLVLNDALKNKIDTVVEQNEILPPFPRSIKIYANIILFFLENHLINKLVIDEDNSLMRTKQFLILTYLYAFHFEVYQLIYMYPGFYDDVFLSFCKDGSTEHELLKNIQLPKTSINSEFGGQPDSESSKHIISYPHTYLRQVLWIRDLVNETGNITQNDLLRLKV
jgi:hypothetical protein